MNRELLTASYELRAKRFERRATSYKLQATRYELERDIYRVAPADDSMVTLLDPSMIVQNSAEYQSAQAPFVN